MCNVEYDMCHNIKTGKTRMKKVNIITGCAFHLQAIAQHQQHRWYYSSLSETQYLASLKLYTTLPVECLDIAKFNEILCTMRAASSVSQANFGCHRRMLQTQIYGKLISQSDIFEAPLHKLHRSIEKSCSVSQKFQISPQYQHHCVVVVSIVMWVEFHPSSVTISGSSLFVQVIYSSADPHFWSSWSN